MQPLCLPVLSARSSAALFMRKESRARKELLFAKAAPGESQCCQPGLDSGKWGLKICHGMECTVEAVWGGWAWAGTSGSSSGTPLLLGAGSFMIHNAVTSSAVSGVSKIFGMAQAAGIYLVPQWSCLSAVSLDPSRKEG